jgi:hypothetical protein
MVNGGLGPGAGNCGAVDTNDGAVALLVVHRCQIETRVDQLKLLGRISVVRLEKTNLMPEEKPASGKSQDDDRLLDALEKVITTDDIFETVVAADFIVVLNGTNPVADA